MCNNTIFTDTFNNHIDEFIEDLLLLYPDDKDIKTGKRYLSTVSLVNKSFILKSWHWHSSKFKNEIESGDITFFLERDYKDVMSDEYDKNYSYYIINRIKALVKKMDNENLKKAVKYIQNLTKLSCLYMD